MKIASAQFCPVHEGIEQNLETHYKLIAIAALNGAKFIVFPEMSVTGYLRQSAKQFSFTLNDRRLDTLQELAVKNKMTIIAGAPIFIDNSLYIGSFIFHPDNKRDIYTKQYLHPGEEEYFVASSAYNPHFQIEGERISLAICADIDHPEHAKAAGITGASMYVPSIFFSPNGLPEAFEALSGYAKVNNMNVLMSNFTGSSYGMPAGGQSAFWNCQGHLVGQLDDSSSGLLLVSFVNNAWEAKSILIN